MPTHSTGYHSIDITIIGNDWWCPVEHFFIFLIMCMLIQVPWDAMIIRSACLKLSETGTWSSLFITLGWLVRNLLLPRKILYCHCAPILVRLTIMEEHEGMFDCIKCLGLDEDLELFDKLAILSLSCCCYLISDWPRWVTIASRNFLCDFLRITTKLSWNFLWELSKCM